MRYNTNSTGNRLEMAPPADRGLTNTVTAVWVADGWSVNWTYLTTAAGRCVIGYNLVRDDAPAVPSVITLNPVTP